MNKEQLKELVKKYFSLTEMTETNDTKENFDSATLVDGTKITNKKDSAFAVGDELYVITEEGEEVLAPSGEHDTASGITITVDGEGKITGIARPDGSDEGSLAEHEEDEMKEEMSSEASDDEEAKEENSEEEKTEMAEHDDDSMNEHYEDGVNMREDIIEAIMSEVGPAIEELRKKMSEHDEMLADHEEKMDTHMSAPASKPVSESKYAKARHKFEKPKAVYNTKRYEKALNLINNSK